jgi:hypothetical protein
MHADEQDPWMAAMRRGNFEQAWAISDRILAHRLATQGFDHTLPRHLQAIWDGRPLRDRHVLVRCYHGLGDTIQFIRFATPLRAIARKVSVWVQPALLPLVAAVDGVDRALPLHEGAPELAYDADIEVMELAHALRVTPQRLAQDWPYIRPTGRRVRLPGGGVRVGLIWAAAGTWMPERSLHFSALAPLLGVPGLVPIALQRGPAAAQTRGLDVHDCGHDDVEVFAATLAALDLLVSVDTFGAHLAGAMGVPVRLMLPHDCDWRWTHAGETTPWYPRMRIYRQPAPGDWACVVRDIARDLTGDYAIRNPAPAAPEQSRRCDVRTCDELTSGELD